jgi:kynurenine formamidase
MTSNIVDLSVPLRDGTDGVAVRLQERLPVYSGRECYAYDLEIPSHTGTYFETPAHLFREGITTDGHPLEKLMLPGVCFRILKGDRCISAEDLDAAAPSAGPGQAANPHALLIDTGSQELGRHAYFSRDAARWMVDRNVALMGSDTPRYDTGFENPTGFFTELFRGGIPIIANITNLHRLPLAGFTLIVLPLSVSGVCTVPCRTVAVLGGLHYNTHGRAEPGGSGERGGAS